MVGHCLRRFPNFSPNHGMDCASCLLALEKHLVPASQAVCERYLRWASIKPALVQGFVLAVLSYHRTGTILGYRLQVDGSLYT